MPSRHGRIMSWSPGVFPGWSVGEALKQNHARNAGNGDGNVLDREKIRM